VPSTTGPKHVAGITILYNVIKYKVACDCIIYILYYILAYTQNNGDVLLENGTMSPEILSHPPPVPLYIYTANRRRMSKILDTLCSNLCSCTRHAYCDIFSQHLPGQYWYSALNMQWHLTLFLSIVPVIFTENSALCSN